MNGVGFFTHLRDAITRPTDQKTTFMPRFTLARRRAEALFAKQPLKAHETPAFREDVERVARDNAKTSWLRAQRLALLAVIHVRTAAGPQALTVGSFVEPALPHCQKPIGSASHALLE